jgi:transmembrane protein 41
VSTLPPLDPNAELVALHGTTEDTLHHSYVASTTVPAIGVGVGVGVGAGVGVDAGTSTSTGTGTGTGYPSASATQLKFPKSVDDVRDLSNTLMLYQERNWGSVMLLFIYTYLFKYCFSIPGSSLLNLLGGALFGTSIAFPLVCLLTSCGASLCYLYSLRFGERIAHHLMGDTLDSFKKQINNAAENNDNLFLYLLFGRLFPVIPGSLTNWLSPLVGIPFYSFFFAVLIGYCPYNYIGVQAGTILAEIRSLDDVFTIGLMLRIGFVALLLGALAVYRSRSKHMHST